MGKLRLLWVSHDRDFILGAIPWLSTQLGIELAGISPDANDAMHRILTMKPEMVLIDESTPGLDVLDTATRVGALSRPPLIIVVSRPDGPASNLPAIGATADAVVPRAELVLELQLALERLMEEPSRFPVGRVPREEQLLVRDVLRSASMLVCVLAPDGTILFANPAMSGLAGASPDELLGRPGWEILNTEPESGIGLQLIARLQREPVVRTELTMASRSGGARRVAWEWSARRNARNAFIALIGVGQDISAVHRAETSIRRLTKQNLELKDRIKWALALDSAGRLAAGISSDALGEKIELVSRLVEGLACVLDGEEPRSQILMPFPASPGNGEDASLGFSIVQGVVRHAGGSIEVQGNPGGGTTFTIRLPAAESSPGPGGRLNGNGYSA